MVGGGFIGLEVAENLCDLGVKVIIVQRPKQLMNTLDYDMATLVHNKLRSKGISLKLGGDVIGFDEKEDLQVQQKTDIEGKLKALAVEVANLKDEKEV